MSIAAYTLLLLGPAFSTVTSTESGCADAVEALPALRVIYDAKPGHGAVSVSSTEHGLPV